VSRTARRTSALALRVSTALVWFVLSKLLAAWLYERPVLSLLATTSVVFVSGGALFGWAGIAVGVGVQLGFLWVVQGLGGIYPWASTAAYAIAGVLAFAVFRYVRGVSRDLCDGRSFAWLAAAGAVGGILSPIIITGTGDGPFLEQVVVWWRSTVISVWVFAPALILIGRRLIPAALVVIPGEPVAPQLRRVALLRGAMPGETPQVVGVETRASAGVLELWLGLLAVVVITAGKILLAGGWSSGGAWWNFLYMAVVWWQARRLRLPGALISAAAVAVGSLVARWIAGPSGGALPADEALVIYAQILALWLVAVLLGVDAEREVRLLDGLADLNERLSQDLQRVIGALTGAVEAKDEYTGHHQQRVQAFALEVGRRLGLSGRELAVLQIAATLHDIGKIGIPESILNKPGKLTPEEWEVMHRHPEIGARMLSRIDGLRDAAPLVLHHQERWDGRIDVRFPGYPAHIAGDAIPLGARIIAVVDCFDAMTTDRPYRRALPPIKAREVLTDERGAQFDPQVVDTFLRLLEERPWV